MEKNKYAAQNRYQAKNRQNLTIAFMKSTEQDLLDYLETVPNKAGYIKELIRKDMRRKSDPTDESILLGKIKDIVRDFYNYQHGEDFCYYAATRMEEMVDLLNIRT